MENSKYLNIGIVLYPGSNCAEDMKHYFPNSFFIWHTETQWRPIDLLIIPGGFAFGDREYSEATGSYTINPGKMAKECPVNTIIMMAHQRKIPIVGVCNGFQILIQMGLLPGKLILNSNARFTCKKVQCQLYGIFKDTHRCLNDGNDENDCLVTLDVANSYGNYQIDDYCYQAMEKSQQVILRYTDEQYCQENGSRHNIAGVCDSTHLVFGMMPHPERNINSTGIRDIIVNIVNQSQHYKLKTLKNQFETEIKNLMNSEHISYKSTRKYLKNLYTEGDHVIQGPGENAGIVDIGDGYAIAIRVESHNHPVFIDPYNGAATGVGGIIRDVFTMGARPIALLDFLRFGHDTRSEHLLNEAVRGIAEYGNCIGIANIGGDCYRENIYSKNPLVNIACIGILKKKNIVYGNVKGDENLLIYVGSKTGNEGINGAAMASNEFTSDTNLEDLKSNIQKGDAFLEKLLVEACLEIVDANLIEGMQDMGAGGLLCSSLEMVQRGRTKSRLNFGCNINVDKIPEKYQMNECDKLISESQERMLLAVKPENKWAVFDIFKKWDLEYKVVGEVTMSGKYTVLNNNNDILFEENMTDFDDPTQDWELVSNSHYNRDRKDRCLEKDDTKWTNYDSTIGCRTEVLGRGELNYSILNIYENGKKLIISWGESFDKCYQCIVDNKAKPLGLVNCLNYGHPKDSMGAMAIFIDELTKKCKEYSVPVLGGNVSLYNATDNESIIPSPILVMIGLIE